MEQFEYAYTIRTYTARATVPTRCKAIEFFNAGVDVVYLRLSPNSDSIVIQPNERYGLDTNLPTAIIRQNLQLIMETDANVQVTWCYSSQISK